MSDDPKPPNGNLPPKLTLRKEESGAIALPTPTPAAGSPPPSKKATARIPLASTESGAADAAGTNYSTKTIRLTPLAASRPLSVAPAVRPPPSATTSLSDLAKRQTSRIPLEAAMATDHTPSATTSLSDLAKRQTSRIPLEAAMATDHTPSAAASLAVSEAPKTIRIKRPGQAPAPVGATIKAPAPSPEPAPAAASDANAQKSKTARVDVEDMQAEDAAQATQRKTIKIRRAEGATAKPIPRSMAVARVEAEAAEAAIAESVRINVAFPIMAAVALVILGVLIVIVAAQAFPSLGWHLPGTVIL
jgi:hypothetical protein